LKRVLLPWVPRWLETNHLTLMTVPWCALILLFSYVARFNVAWLWGVSAMIAAQYVTDLLDGAIGRQRGTGLVKWGFYMDHFLDFFFLCSLLIGYAILLPQVHRTALFFVMALFAGFMVNSFLAFGATNRFQIAYMGMGPTEIRLVFILINTVIVFCGTRPLVAALPYTLAGASFGLFFTVYRTQQELWRIDMAAKLGHDAVPAPPPSRHRLSFIATLILSAIGTWLAILPTREVAVRLASLTLFAIAAGLFVVSLRDFRKFRRQRRFFLAALWIHLPYILVGLLLLVGLRVWFVLAPAGVDFPPVRAESGDVAIVTGWDAWDTWDAGDAWGEGGTERWGEYCAAREALLAIENRYRGFIHIDAVSEPRDHADAFALFFAAYARRCVMDAKATRFLLDHPVLRHAIDAATNGDASRLVRASSNDTVWIRLAVGAAYLRLYRGHATVDSPLLPCLDADLDFLVTRLPALFRETLY
ncbi:MAG: hypothetical protein FWF84_04355, partial [Kiritimatiellaeota bacterium]|nr:hypothetical protein [Kiritimatiellota bacterium]